MSSPGFAPPVGGGSYAVVFTSRRNPGDEGYTQTAEEMVARVAASP